MLFFVVLYRYNVVVFCFVYAGGVTFFGCHEIEDNHKNALGLKTKRRDPR
jgi:hypothetical protein